MKTLFLVILFILFGCSHSQITEEIMLNSNEVNIMITSEKYLLIKNIFDREASYIKTIQEADLKLELKNLLNSITKITYKENACGAGQVACSDKNHDGEISINDNFFMMPKLEQYTAILHEASHLQSKDFEHVKCTKIPSWGYECDELINSPYGIEYKYLLHKFTHTKDESITRILLKIFNRINKI